MTKAVLLPLGFIFLLAAATPSHSQTSPTDAAVSEAVLRQANTIVLRQKLVAAKATAARGELVNAAKLYQESTVLALQIGSGIDMETAQAISGLASTRLTLARQAQAQGDLPEADKQINQVLKVDPKNIDALALKRQNDQLIALSRGRVPDAATMEQIPVVKNQRIDAGTLVQDGKLLYEMGKLEEAEVKLKEAIKIDPDNVGAFYYLNLIQQAQFSRANYNHTADTQIRMQQVEKQWVLPRNQNLSVPNPYASTNLVYTGPGRQAIVSKLDRIRLETVSYDGLPLSEVLRSLSEQAKIRDPEKIGINFLINPNAEASLPSTTGPGGFGFPGEGRPAAVDPTTGLPQATPGAGAAAAEQVDVGSIIVKLNLANVRLTDVLDAIVLVADHPIKYSVQDFAIVFSSKSAESAPLFMRTFKVDANTFFQGLESVNSTSFGSSSSSGGGGGGSSGGGGGGGGGGGSGQGTGAVVPVVDMSPGASQLRTTQGGQGGGGQGGGGGGGGRGGGGGGGAGGTTGGNGAVSGWNFYSANNGGVNFLTLKRTTDEIGIQVRNFFELMGVDLNPPKALFFNDRLGLLFVKATESDLDTIERAIETLNQISPQVHIKARFIEVEQDDTKQLGFDWYLGQFGHTVVASGGSSPSLNVPVTAGSPLGIFPGSTAAGLISGSASDQLVTGGLRNGSTTVGTITGILTDPNFQVAIHALEQRSGFENLAEPEVTTTSGRQTQMRATKLITVITGVNFQQGGGGGTGTGTGLTQ